MQFFALSEEQIELLVNAHTERPMLALSDIKAWDEDPKPINLERNTLLKLLRSPKVKKHGVDLALRDASIPGGYVWEPHPRPERGPTEDAIRSLCMGLALCVEWQGRLSLGETGMPSLWAYDDIGLDPSPVQRLKRFLEVRLKRLCPYRAIDVWSAAAVERGDLKPSGVKNRLVHVSESARLLLEKGGRWNDLSLDLDYVPFEEGKARLDLAPKDGTLSKPRKPWNGPVLLDDYLRSLKQTD